VSGAASLQVGLTVPFDVCRRGIKPECNPPQSPHDKIVLIRRSQPHRDVGFPHGQAQRPSAGYEFHQDARVLDLQGRKAWGQDVGGEHFGARHADQSFKPCVVPPNAPQHTDNFGFGPFGLRAYTFSSKCQHIAIGRPMQKPHAQPGFKRCKPPADRGLSDPELTRRRGQAAVSGYRKKEAEVIPIEHFKVRCIFA
jgi:hypothetical protein